MWIFSKAGGAWMLACLPVSGAIVTGEIIDAGTSNRLPARLYIQSDAGKWFFPTSTASFGSAVRYEKSSGFNPRAVEMHTTLSPQPFRVELPPGSYTFTAERGKEYFALTQRVDVASEDMEVKLPLRRWIDMAARGWFSGDTHNHRDPAELPNVMLAEDVNVALPMVYWTTVDAVSPARSRRSMKGDYPAAVREIDNTHVYWPRNTEYEIFNTGGTNHTLGALLVVNHRTVFDLPALPLSEVAARARKEGALLDLEKHNWDWSAALVALVRPDLFELANNHHWRVEYSVTNWGVRAPAWMQVGTGSATERDWTLYGFQSYYALLNCGFRLRPAAGSANGVHPVPLGFGRVYVRVPRPFTFQAWMRGLNEGHSFVTTGPMLFTRFNGEEAGHVFSGRLRREQNVAIDGEVWSEQPLEKVEVVAVGELMHSLAPKSEKQPSGAYRTRFNCRVGWRDSGWVAVRCFERREDGRFRFAHTAPVYFDVPGHPQRPRQVEAEWLAQRVRQEMERSSPVLSPKAMEEYRRALAVYEGMLNGE